MKSLVCILALAIPLAAGTADSFLIRGATVHPVAGADIANGSILVVDGKIVGIGHNLAAPKGIKIIEGKGLHVYPGMIDSATEIGLNEIGSTRESVDTGELGQFNPQLRAEIAVNPASEHIPVTRANGITSVMTLPMSAGRGGDGGGGGRNAASAGKAPIITGQAALIHLDGWTWEEMEVRKSAAMTMRFPMLQNISARFPDAPAGLFPRQSQADAKKNYETQLRELKEFFDEARRYQKAKAAKAPGFKTDLKMEAMLDVLDGKLPLLAVTPRERAMRDAVQFGDREKVRVVLAEPREVGKMGPELKAKNVAVIVGPTLALPAEEDDPYDSAYTLPDRFYRAGVKIAFGTFGNEFARNLPYQAATAVAFGLPHDEAMKAITLNPAQIWGMGDKIGSIEEGKWADLIVTDGDPLETTTQMKQMFIKGKPVDLDNKHRRLYEKYLNRP